MQVTANLYQAIPTVRRTCTLSGLAGAPARLCTAPGCELSSGSCMTTAVLAVVLTLLVLCRRLVEASLSRER